MSGRRRREGGAIAALAGSSSLRPLTSRNFALVWSAALVSNVGSWMQAVALGIVVTTETHRPGWTGIVAAAAFLPNGLLAPVGGALADRLDRRRWLLTTTLAEAALAAVLSLLAFTGHEGPLLLTVTALAGGIASAVGFPAYQAMLPDLVPRRDLLPAISLSSAQFNVGRVLGPALVAVCLHVNRSGSFVFAANAASFFAVVVALLLVRLPAVEHAPGAGPVARIVEGVRTAAASPGCRSPILLITVVALIGSPFIALVPAVAITGLHGGSGATSVLVTLQGVGAVAGALALAPLARRFTRRRVLVGALFGLGGLLALYGSAPSLAAAAVGICLVGGCYIWVLSGLNTVVQLHAPAEARGRILGLYMLALGTVYPIGALVQGQIADSVGIRVLTAGSGVVLVAVMGLLFILGRGLFAGLEDPAPAAGEQEVAHTGPEAAVAMAAVAAVAADGAGSPSMSAAGVPAVGTAGAGTGGRGAGR